MDCSINLKKMFLDNHMMNAAPKFENSSWNDGAGLTVKTNRWMDGQTDRQIDRQTNRQTQLSSTYSFWSLNLFKLIIEWSVHIYR